MTSVCQDVLKQWEEEWNWRNNTNGAKDAPENKMAKERELQREDHPEKQQEKRKKKEDEEEEGGEGGEEEEEENRGGLEQQQKKRKRMNLKEEEEENQGGGRGREGGVKERQEAKKELRTLLNKLGRITQNCKIFLVVEFVFQGNSYRYEIPRTKGKFAGRALAKDKCTLALLVLKDFRIQGPFTESEKKLSELVKPASLNFFWRLIADQNIFEGPEKLQLMEQVLKEMIEIPILGCQEKENKKTESKKIEPKSNGNQQLKENDKPLNVNDKGGLMMQKMGWTPGTAIGKSSQGIVEPIKSQGNPGQLSWEKPGLGFTVSKSQGNPRQSSCVRPAFDSKVSNTIRDTFLKIEDFVASGDSHLTFLPSSEEEKGSIYLILKRLYKHFKSEEKGNTIVITKLKARKKKAGRRERAIERLKTELGVY